MHVYLSQKYAEAHRDQLIQQADMERLAARVRSSLRRHRANRVVVRMLRPDESSLPHLADIAPARHEAVGAFDDGALIGAARYVVCADDPHAAEIAVEVADSRQREGIATRLLDALAGSARAHGVTRFTATALKPNDAVLPLARRLGWPVGVQARGRELVFGVCFGDA